MERGGYKSSGLWVKGGYFLGFKWRRVGGVEKIVKLEVQHANMGDVSQIILTRNLCGGSKG